MTHEIFERGKRRLQQQKEREMRRPLFERGMKVDQIIDAVIRGEMTVENAILACEQGEQIQAENIKNWIDEIRASGDPDPEGSIKQMTAHNEALLYRFRELRHRLQREADEVRKPIVWKKKLADLHYLFETLRTFGLIECSEATFNSHFRDKDLKPVPPDLSGNAKASDPRDKETRAALRAVRLKYTDK